MINSVLLLLAVTASQTHTPSATVSGDIVTVDADIAFLPDASAAGVSATLLAGTELVSSPNVAASTDGASPIQWRLPPGQYDITAYGFPDDRVNPVRNVAILTVTIQAPDRSDAIAAALKKLTLALFDAGKAQADLQTLNPTRQELIDALTKGAP